MLSLFSRMTVVVTDVREDARSQEIILHIYYPYLIAQKSFVRIALISRNEEII